MSPLRLSSCELRVLDWTGEDLILKGVQRGVNFRCLLQGFVRQGCHYLHSSLAKVPVPRPAFSVDTAEVISVNH